MKETLQELLERLHCGHVDFDQLAGWYWNSQGSISRLQARCVELEQRHDDLLSACEVVYQQLGEMGFAYRGAEMYALMDGLKAAIARARDQ